MLLVLRVINVGGIEIMLEDKFSVKERAIIKHFDIRDVDSCLTCPNIEKGNYDEGNECKLDIIDTPWGDQICNLHPKHPNFKKD